MFSFGIMVPTKVRKSNGAPEEEATAFHQVKPTGRGLTKGEDSLLPDHSFSKIFVVSLWR